VDAERIFVSSCMQEAMHLLEHCTNLAIGNVRFSYFIVPCLVNYILIIIRCCTLYCNYYYLCINSVCLGRSFFLFCSLGNMLDYINIKINTLAWFCLTDQLLIMQYRAVCKLIML